MAPDEAISTFVPQLKVPALTLNSLSLRQATPEAMTDWLENIPKADLVSLSRELKQFLPQLNQLQINAAKRLKLLEQLRPLTHYCLNQLDLRARSQTLELNAAQRQAANMAQLLQNHLAIGYKHVLLEALANQRPRITTLSLHRSLAELSLCLLRASSQYCPPSTNLMFELHQLFQLGSHQQLLHEQVLDGVRPDSGQLSIVQLYKRALLFSLSHNGHLRHSEQHQVFIACGRWSRDVQLTSAIGQNTGAFKVYLDSDLPPRHPSITLPGSAQNHVQELTSSDWWLDTQSLCQKLIQSPKRQNSLLPHPLPPHLIEHLSRVWRGPIPRQNERSPCNGVLQLSTGFCASHYFLAGEINFDTWLDQQGLDWRVRYTNQLTRGAAWDQAFDTGAQNEEHSDKEREDVRFPQHHDAADSAAAKSEHAPFRLYEARLIDSSIGGYNIELQGKLPPRLLAGELVAVRAHEHHQKKGCHWNLAMIRWLKRQSQGAVQAGLQLLPAAVRLAAISIATGAGENSHYLRCFILPDDVFNEKTDSSCATLLMPRIRFSEGAKVQLIDRGKASSGRIEQLEQAASGFLQVRFTPEQQACDNRTTLTLDFSY